MVWPLQEAGANCKFNILNYLNNTFIIKWDELAGAKTNAKIAKVDCTVHNPICKENEVKGFPTLLFFQDGKNLGKHQGGRDLASLKKSIDKFMNPGLI